MVSAFHGGAELVAHMKKKHRRRKSQQQFEEQQLQDSLETGENTVGQRYSTDLKELGEIVRVGDGRCSIPTIRAELRSLKQEADDVINSHREGSLIARCRCYAS